jgi:hypothetical protein
MTEHETGEGRARSRRHWQTHSKAQEESGLSRAEYCRRHDLSYHALTYWQRKLSGPSRQHTQLVPVPMERATQHYQPGPSSGIKILLDNRIAIEVAEEFSPGTLSRILSVLENR